MPETFSNHELVSPPSSTAIDRGAIYADRYGYCRPSTTKWLEKQDILVVCDYATRYPEAIPMKDSR